MYETENPDPEVRRDKRRATGWQPDPELERLLALKQDNPDRFERITSPNKLMELGYYASGKVAAERTSKR